MPSNTVMFPTLLRKAGYYCTNHTKEDYNLTKPDGVWDQSGRKAHYRNRKSGSRSSLFSTTQKLMKAKFAIVLMTRLRIQPR